MKRSDELNKAVEDELLRRYQQQQASGGLPPFAAASPSRASSSNVMSRPGTAPALPQPLTRPTSRNDTRFNFGSEFGSPTNVKETLMQLKRASSATPGGKGTSTSFVSSMTSSVMGSRPSSAAALTLLELHKDDSRMSSNDKSSPAGSFFERTKFRDLYRQLQKNAKKDFVQTTWDESALAAMEANLFRPASAQDADNASTLSDDLRQMHENIDRSVTAEVGGDGASVATDAHSRLFYFREQLVSKRLKTFPALQHLVEMVYAEHDRYMAQLQRDVSVSEASLLRDTLRSTVEELAEERRQKMETEKKYNELLRVFTEVKDSHLRMETNQKELEEYVDELRVTLSTFTNNNLRGAAAMRPDTSSKAGFVDAIRRLAKEVDVLRQENVKLSEVAANHVDVQERQSAEMQILLEKASQFQQQVAQLKSVVRVMKAYVDELETRTRELRNVHEENELLRSSVPMQVAKFEREFVIPYELCVSLAQHQLLQQKAVTFVCPQEYADVGTIPTDEKLVQLVTNRYPSRISVQQHNTEDFYENEDDEDYVDSNDLGSVSGGGGSAAGDSAGGGGGGGAKSGTTPSSGRSLAPSSVAPSEFFVPTSNLPLHLSSRFGNVKLKQMNVVDVKNIITELFTEYVNAREKKMVKDPQFVPLPFDQFTKEWAHRRLKGEKVSFEQNLSLFYWADVYRHKAPEMVMYWKASAGHVSGFIHEVVTVTLSVLKSKLQLLEPVTKKQKDRITRDAFITTVKTVLPLLTPLQLEALCASSIHAQEGRFAEEVCYEPFFDRTNSGGVFMYDALSRAVISHAELLSLQVEEKLYHLIHERNVREFETLSRMRDECGSSGTAGLQQMKIESALAEKVGKCPLRLVSEAVSAVDVHVGKKTLWLYMAIAAGAPEINKVVGDTVAEEEALDKTFDIPMLAKNLRRGVTFTFSSPEKKTEEPLDASGAAGGAKASERTGRPSSATFV